MFNVCPGCGEYGADKLIEGEYAVCPNCGFQHKFRRLPLFVLTGASGVGKTTICLALAARAKDFVIMESDILWRDEFKGSTNDYRDYREMWLRVCKNISQAGKPVVLCGAGVPDQFERCIERRYFSTLHYLALTCDDESLVSRLRNRPAWRGSSADEYIAEHLAFNRWLVNNAESTQPPMTLLNTAAITVNESVAAVEQWLRLRLNLALVVLGLVTLAFGSPVRAQSVNPCDTPDKLPQSFFEVPAGPQGTWSASVEPDRRQTDDPRVPVVVAGAGQMQGPASRRGMRLGCGTLRNRSPNPVAAIQLRWILARARDRAVIEHQGDSPETILLQGHTSDIELSISGEGVRRMDFSLISFADLTRALQREGVLDGDYVLFVGINEARFADGTVWKAGS